MGLDLKINYNPLSIMTNIKKKKNTNKLKLQSRQTILEIKCIKKNLIK